LTILSRPQVVTPKYTVTQEQTLAISKLFHGDRKDINLINRMVKNTTIKKRHIVQPLGKTLIHQGVEKRNEIYFRESKKLTMEACKKVLKQENMKPTDIDLLIVTSCTGFLFPSLTAHLINSLKMKPTTKQLPIAQLGCVAGSVAINMATDFWKIYPEKSVMIVSVELCSLLYQPTDDAFGVLISDALFGDAAAATIVSSKVKKGIRIEGGQSYLYPNSEHYIAYDFKSTGFHFKLDRAVPKTMAVIAPEIEDFFKNRNVKVSDLSFYAIHAGGPRILNDLVKLLDLPEEEIAYSRKTLANYGNIASVFVFDALNQVLSSGHLKHGQQGLIAACGPGLSAEFSLGTYVSN
jgi:1,3,6,8-tetrahydroxynaphthalene synthase